MMGFKPLPAFIRQANQARRHMTDDGGQGGEFVVSCLVIEKCGFLHGVASRVEIEGLVGLG
jgi:hypothetical protein